MAGWRTPNGGCECKHPISNTTKEKNHTMKFREGEGAMVRLRNGKWDPLYTNTRCSTGQVPIATEVANPEEKNADHLAPPAANLLSTTDSKDVRFPWVILYYFTYLYIKQKAQDSSEIHRSPWNCVSSVRKLLRVTFLPPRTWRWLLNL